MNNFTYICNMKKIKNKIIVIFSSHLGNEYNDKFINHIHKTIETKHDVHCYENNNEHSLSDLYNKAIEKYADINSIMVFCHPDITFKTNKWGKILLNHFNNTDYGILGVAGTTFLPKSGMWWENKTKMVGIVEHTDGKTQWVNKYSEPFIGVQPTVIVDGLFIAIDPDKIIHKFDNTYGKFHFYDLGFCFPNYLDGVDVGVISNIRILHNSVGKTNEDWEKNRIKFADDYQEELPVGIQPTFKDFNIKLSEEPKVSIIIPTKNNFDLLKDNLNSWKELVKYKNYEIIIADTGSDDETIKKYDELLNNNIKLVKYNYFNFGKINNAVVRKHVSDDTELILFCNDDIVLLNDALTRCVDIYLKNKKNTGTIGIRLHFFDGTVQHCGIISMIDQNNGLHLNHVNFRENRNYQMGVNYNSVGNTGAFLLMNKNLFNEIGGFNENYIECFEDVELNFTCLMKRKKNITVCDAVAYHYESVSRNRTKDKLERLREDYKNNLYPFYLKNQDFLKKFMKKIQINN
jgi:GT2 family glycosyltransferase